MQRRGHDGNDQAGGGLEAATERCVDLWAALEVVADFLRMKNRLFHFLNQEYLLKTMHMMKAARQMMLI